VKAVGLWRREKERGEDVTHGCHITHSVMTLRFFSVGEEWGGAGSAQSNRVIQSSQPPGGTVLQQGNVCAYVWRVAARTAETLRYFSEDVLRIWRAL